MLGANLLRAIYRYTLVVDGAFLPKRTGYSQCAQPFLPKHTSYSQCAQSPTRFLPILSMQENNWHKFFLNVGTGTQFDKMAYIGKIENLHSPPTAPKKQLFLVPCLCGL
jgi:hypothetical protein